MTDILTPVGRMVQGDAFKPNTTTMDGAPLTDKQGNPRVDYFIALAIPKTSPDWPNFIAALQQVAATEAPNDYRKPNFAYKVIDGDAADTQGRPYSRLEGFGGCYVLRMSGGFAPQVYTQGGASVIVDPNGLKRGYYIRVNTNVRGKPHPTNPGLFLNPTLIEVVGYGEEIKSGPDGKEVFGAAPAAVLPPGASATPVATSPGLAAPVPGVPVVAPIAAPVATSPGLAAPVPGVPVVAPIAAPVPGVPVAAPIAAPVPGVPVVAPVAAPVPGVPVVAPVAPAPDFLKGPIAAPVPGVPVAAPPAIKMTAQATATYDAYIAAGWTHEQLVTNGLIDDIPF